MLIFSDFDGDHGLINYIETKAKGCHLKKFTCKGTLRQVFIRVYRLELHFNHILVVLTQLCELLSPKLLDEETKQLDEYEHEHELF
jgi:hypothetical protein